MLPYGALAALLDLSLPAPILPSCSRRRITSNGWAEAWRGGGRGRELRQHLYTT